MVICWFYSFLLMTAGWIKVKNCFKKPQKAFSTPVLFVLNKNENKSKMCNLRNDQIGFAHNNLSIK